MQRECGRLIDLCSEKPSVFNLGNTDDSRASDNLFPASVVLFIYTLLIRSETWYKKFVFCFNPSIR